MRTYTINPRQSRRLLAPVNSITAARGTVAVSQPEGRVPAVTLEQGESLACQDRAGFDLVAIAGGCTVSVIYSDEVTTPHPRGKRARTARGRREAAERTEAHEPAVKGKGKKRSKPSRRKVKRG